MFATLPTIPRLAPAVAACLAVLAIVALPAVHPQIEAHPSRTPGASPPDTCTCAEALLTHGWCAACSTGTVAAVRFPSADLYDIIDAHGHTFEPSGVSCRECRSAMDVEGFCEESGIGYAGGLAYVSRLAWLLAKGSPVRPELLACEACRSHVEAPGWCDSCGLGIVGGTSYRDREFYEKTLTERTRLVAAAGKVSTCTLCAVVLFADGRCPTCNIVYRNGAPVGGAGRP